MAHTWAKTASGNRISRDGELGCSTDQSGLACAGRFLNGEESLRFSAFLYIPQRRQWEFHIQYFTKVGRIPENRGAERVYARSAPLFSGFSQPFRDLLILGKGYDETNCVSSYRHPYHHG